MPTVLLISLLTLGGVGLYLAMPGGRLNVGRAGYLVLALAVAVVAGALLARLAGPESRVWFIGLALIGLWGAVRVVTHERPVYSALYFILVIVAVTGLLVLMNAEFLAAALLIIYAGAILVTYVFVIMLAQQEGGAPARYDRQAREPAIGCLTGIILLAVISGRLMLGSADAAEAAVPQVDLAQAAGTVENVGTHLLTNYAVGVELAGVLLLAAMVGAIAIARRKAVAIEEGAQ
jgi:NADH-quinone oxidoreductase subunit J